MKKWLWLALFSSALAQADMLDALAAYENKDYTAAKQQFAELLPLGNELAAFNLGAMAYQGEGQDANLSQALAYFKLAAELGYDQATTILADLNLQAGEQELKLATQRFEQLKQTVVIVSTALVIPDDSNSPEPIKRVHPEYPKSAASSGQFGYVKLRFLVNEQGEVTAVDTLDSYPKKVFDRSAIKAIKRWRYQPSTQKHVLSVRLEYSLGDGISLPAVEKAVLDRKLWDYAAAGVPEYQFAFGTLLSLIKVQSQNMFWYDPALPLAATPDFSIFKRRAHLQADFEGFLGRATVKVAADGTISEHIDAWFEPQSEVTNLVGLKLKGKVEAEQYRLIRSSVLGGSRVNVAAQVRAPRSMSDMFWWEQAAKNGSADAQRVMAAYDSQWETYLLNQQNAEVMAWTGTRMILEGKREQGMALLEQAIAKNYQPAKEMKQQFM